MSFDRQMFGLRIREMREAHGMTQFDLALALDVESNFVSRMERGTRTCSFEMLVRLAKALNVSTDFLLTGKSSDPMKVKNELLGIVDRLESVINTLFYGADTHLQQPR